MALELNGTTGVSLVQDGVVTADDLSSTLDLTGKTVTLPSGAITSAALPAGSVLQVVQSRNNAGSITTTSSSFIDTGLSVTITPTSSSNKVLIMANFTSTSDAAASHGGSKYAIYRGATNLYTDGVSNYGMITFDNSGYIHAIAHMSFLDSPSTTSSTDYKIYMGAIAGATASLQRDWGGVTMIAMEIAG